MVAKKVNFIPKIRMQELAVGKVIAGIGLFFIGSQMLSSFMQKGASQQLRRLVQRWTQNPFLAALWGVVLAVVLQKPNLVAIVVATLVSTKMLRPKVALPIVSWSNPGSTLLVFLIFLDIQLAVFYLIGIAGIGLAQSRSLKWSYIFGALFGICLMYYGLTLIKAFSLSLKNEAWVNSLFLELRYSYLSMFLIGLVSAVISQSVLTVVVIAINFTSVGLFSFQQCVMVMYGANLGTALFTIFFIWSYTGAARQAIVFQILSNVAATLLFVLLFYAEMFFQIPMVQALTQQMSSSMSTQLAYVLLLLRSSIPLVTSLFPRVCLAGMERVCPYTEVQENLPSLHYMKNIELIPQKITLNLFDKEHVLLFEHLHLYLVRLKKEERHSILDYPKTHQAFLHTSSEIQKNLNTLLSKETEDLFSQKLLACTERHYLLGSIEENLYHLALLEKEKKPTRLLLHSLEALDTMILQVMDALLDKTEEQTALLHTLTAAKGPLMTSLRTRISRSSELEEKEKKEHVLWIDLFERNIWLLNRYARLLFV